tara:strand:- start:1966 stop:3567 length:1602 start_codon:yes stop_codon:yes gene_type:complete
LISATEAFHRKRCNPVEPLLVGNDPTFWFETDESFLPVDLQEDLKPIVKACGMTEINQLPSMRIYTGIKNRLAMWDRLEKQASEDDPYYIDDFDTSTTDYKEYCGYASNRGDNAMHWELELRMNDERKKLHMWLDRLDLNNTIDHTPDFFTEFNNLRSQFTEKMLREEFNLPKFKAEDDEISRQLAEGTIKQRGNIMRQRCVHAINQAAKAGWFIVFDTLTLADDRIAEFNSNDSAMRDHFRDLAEMVGESLGYTVRESRKRSSEFFHYICVPEYGTKEGRLHWHCVYLMKSLPCGTQDPNYGRRTPNRTEVPTLKYIWHYGNNMPIAVRYTGDAFSRLAWRWPVDKNGQRKKAGAAIGVALYVTKYITKKTDQDLVRLNPRGKSWNQQLRQEMRILAQRQFRVRCNREFGKMLPSMSRLQLTSLVELTRLHYSVTPMNLLLRQSAKRELRRRLGILSIVDIQVLMPETLNLLKFLRSLTRATPEFNLANFMSTLTPSLHETDVSKEVYDYVFENGLDTKTVTPRFKGGSASK